MRAAWVQGLLGQGVCYAVCVPHDVTRLAVGLYPMALAAARYPCHHDALCAWGVLGGSTTPPTMITRGALAMVAMAQGTQVSGV